jgi:hypothetical protein
MATVSQFAQHLLRLDPKVNQARLCFYNYLKYLVDPSVLFTPGIVQQFYSRALQFEQWQTDAHLLGETVRSDVTGFLKNSSPQEDMALWQYLRHPETLQVVPLKIYADLEELVKEEHQARQKSGEQVKTMRTSDNQGLALILSPTGSLEVKVYPAMALIWGTRLRPVSPVTHLHYTSKLELVPHVRQVLEGNLLTTHCFEVTVDRVQGLTTRGALFKIFETFVCGGLAETQNLFLQLKKVEKHFINPQTDPFYQEIVGRLEKAKRLIASPSAENLAEADKALNRGRFALRVIFPNDRLLTLLITHLEHGISQRLAPEVSGPGDALK